MPWWRMGDNLNFNETSIKPVEVSNVKKPTKQKFIDIFGGAAVALVVVIIIALACFFLKRLRRAMSRTFDADSSFPSTSADWQRAASTSVGGLSAQNPNHLLQLKLLDLEHATAKFSEGNIIGEDAFGLVYKGLLTDGTIVAIKRRLHHPIQSLRYKVNHTAYIKHKNLVKLIGFCEEKHQQFLVYEYLMNRDVGNHLYDDEGLPTGKLDMHQRLLIAIGAAKGLEHLHSFRPPILHMHFGTRSVLIDENFTAKVSDFGVFGLLVEECYALPSSAIDRFLDPQLRSYKDFSERSDVYSFGVFLLELISGRKAAFTKNQSNEQESLVCQANSITHLGDFVDKKLRNYCSTKAMKQLVELALLCVDSNSRRPSMKNVVDELEEIHRTIKGSCTNEETAANVTLGSELFKLKGSSSHTRISQPPVIPIIVR